MLGDQIVPRGALAPVIVRAVPKALRAEVRLGAVQIALSLRRLVGLVNRLKALDGDSDARRRALATGVLKVLQVARCAPYGGAISTGQERPDIDPISFQRAFEVRDEWPPVLALLMDLRCGRVQYVQPRRPVGVRETRGPRGTGIPSDHLLPERRDAPHVVARPRGQVDPRIVGLDLELRRVVRAPRGRCSPGRRQSRPSRRLPAERRGSGSASRPRDARRHCARVRGRAGTRVRRRS